MSAHLFIIQNLKNIHKKGIPKVIIIGDEIREITDNKQKQIIINDYHVLPTAGQHAGIQRTLRTIQKRYLWKNMRKDIAEFISRCELCQKNKKTKNTKNSNDCNHNCK